MPECAPRRVLMTGDTVGGVWTFAIEMARHLTARGSEVCLATFGGAATQVQRDQAASIERLYFFDSDLKLEWMADPWDDVIDSCELLAKLATDFVPDLVHLNTYSHVMLPWTVPVVLTAHSCVVSWWAAVKGTAVPRVWDKYQAEVRSALETADFVTAPSRAMLNSLIDNYRVTLPAARVIPNGCHSAYFRPGPKEPFVLAAGRLWDEGKNIAALAKIASRLTWPLYLAGEQRNGDGTSLHYGAANLLGPLPYESLAKWYARAAIYALPARYEPFGLSALEAALCGCALVLGDIPSLREVWGDSAVFVDPNDADGVYGAIQGLIQNSRRREEVAERCREKAQQYTSQRMGAEYVDAYTAAARRCVCTS